MGTLREAAVGRIFAPQWQIVALRELSVMDSVRACLTRFCSFSAFYQIFSSFGCQAHRNGSVVYASHNCLVGRVSRPARLIAYTTIG